MGQSGHDDWTPFVALEFFSERGSGEKIQERGGRSDRSVHSYLCNRSEQLHFFSCTSQDGVKGGRRTREEVILCNRGRTA